MRNVSGRRNAHCANASGGHARSHRNGGHRRASATCGLGAIDQRLQIAFRKPRWRKFGLGADCAGNSANRIGQFPAVPLETSLLCLRNLCSRHEKSRLRQPPFPDFPPSHGESDGGLRPPGRYCRASQPTGTWHSRPFPAGSRATFTEFAAKTRPAHASLSHPNSVEVYSGRAAGRRLPGLSARAVAHYGRDRGDCCAVSRTELPVFTIMLSAASAVPGGRSCRTEFTAIATGE
jgi:hypothetical protein